MKVDLYQVKLIEVSIIIEIGLINIINNSAYIIS